MPQEDRQTDYKDTLNLPQTDFPMRGNLSTREPQILARWETIGLHELILAKNRGKQKYVLHDGPPYANGDVHLGTALNKILKDFVVRYKTMCGFFCNYVPGWDCHGLPIELKVLGERDGDAAQKSALQIRRACHDYAMKYVAIQREQFQRLGVGGDWQHPYLTLLPEYEVGILRVFRRLVEQRLVYKGLKPVHWCTSCKTALAEAEVEYQNHRSPSVYVRFPILDKEKKEFLRDLPNLSIVIWTTTPWTLPANLAVCLHPDKHYVALAVDGETMIVAEPLQEAFVKDCGLKVSRERARFLGRELEGLACQHPLMDKESLVILGEHVTMEQGTGCVHTAPGHGEEDYAIAQKYSLPIFVPVDDDGRFTSEFPLMQGMDVWDANKPIIDLLRKKNLLIKSDVLEHSYPHCWRCHRPIVFRATEQWFMSMEPTKGVVETPRGGVSTHAAGMRERALAEIDRVRWIPRWGRDRIYNMVAVRPDWCLSRQRVWGVPIPALVCKACGKSFLDLGVIDRFIDLVAKSGTNAWYETDVGTLAPNGLCCPACQATEFAKEQNILDVWFDSGSSHVAVLEGNPDLHSPADLYLEGSDQHRGWFQTSLLIGVGVHDRAPYLAVLTHGFLLDERGEAMHKSKGNVISPLDIIDKMGADVLRLWVASEDYRADVKVSYEILERIAEAYRRIRNTFKFLLGNLYDFIPETHTVPYDDMEEIDKWALHELNELTRKIAAAYENFEFHKIYHLAHTFCVVEMSSLYLDILKDRLYTFHKESVARKSGQTALWFIMSYLVRLLAPVLPYTTDEAWGFMRRHEKSVHLSDFPTPQETWNAPEIAQKMDLLLQVRGEVAKALEEARRATLIGHSLDARVVITVSDEPLYDLLKKNEPDLETLFIVSSCEVRKVQDVGASDSASEMLQHLEVEIEEAPGEKCSRCWRIRPEVGTIDAYEEICSRCADVMRRIGHEEG
jgi:isoleucyl-tRNA synthetase